MNNLRDLEGKPRELWKKIRDKYKEEMKKKYENEYIPETTEIYKRNMKRYNESDDKSYKPQPPYSFEKFFDFPYCERCKSLVSRAYYYSAGQFVCYHCYTAKIPTDMLNWLVEQLSEEKLRQYYKYLREGKWNP